LIATVQNDQVTDKLKIAMVQNSQLTDKQQNTTVDETTRLQRQIASMAVDVSMYVCMYVRV
jgi:hypothetical protein